MGQAGLEQDSMGLQMGTDSRGVGRGESIVWAVGSAGAAEESAELYVFVVDPSHCGLHGRASLRSLGGGGGNTVAMGRWPSTPHTLGNNEGSTIMFNLNQIMCLNTIICSP